MSCQRINEKKKINLSWTQLGEVEEKSSSAYQNH